MRCTVLPALFTIFLGRTGVAAITVVSFLLAIPSPIYAETCTELNDLSAASGSRMKRICNDGGLLEFNTYNDAGDTKTERMVLTNDGKLGIGTIQPSRTVGIMGNTSFQLQLGYTGGTSPSQLGSDNNGFLRIHGHGGIGLATGPDAAEIMRITTPLGNHSVGIGTVSPAVSLSVIGEVQVSNSGIACTTATQGALRYSAGTLYVCNGSTFAAAAPDNLGNHTATTNIQLSGNWLSNDGGNEGISVANNGLVTFTSGLLWEDGVHRITNNDGGGNVNIRFGHEYSSGEKFTHTGSAVHILGTVDSQSVGALELKTSTDSGNAGDTVGGWKTLRLVGNGTLLWDGGHVWHAGNDGAGSGLDADTVDGYHASALLPDNLGNHTATTNIQLSGNWLSNDGDSEGIRITNAGVVSTSAGLQVAGLLTANGNIYMPGDTQIYSSNSGYLNMYGGTGWITGAGVQLYGQDHATNAGQHFLNYNSSSGGFLQMRHHNGSSWANVMRLDANGNVGIGTTNPAGYKLNVNGTSYLSGAVTTGSTLETGGAITAGGNLIMGNNAITSSAGAIRDANGGWVRTYGNTGWFNGTHSGGWHMNDTTWVRSYNNKNVLTGGTMRADSGFQVGNAGANFNVASNGNTSTGTLTTGGDITLPNTASIVMGSGAGDKIYLYGTGYGIGIESGTLTNWAGGRHRWRLGGGSVSAGTEYMDLTTSGLTVSGGVTTGGTVRGDGGLQVGAGGSNFSVGSGGWTSINGQLNVALLSTFNAQVVIPSMTGGQGDIVCWKTSNPGMGRLQRNSGTNCAPSDARLKEHVKPYTGGLETVMKLRPVTYGWKDRTRDKDIHGNPKLIPGFIAQEVLEVIPQVVTGTGKPRLDDNGVEEIDYHGVNHGALTAPLVAAVQELKRQNDALRAANQNLQADIEAANASLADLADKVETLARQLGNTD